MGLFDHVRIEDGFGFDLPGFDGDPTSVDWQTKTFKHPTMDVYKITKDGRLFQEDARHEAVPEEERPGYDKEIGRFENEWEKGWGMFDKVHEGWSDTNYHGILEFHRVVDGESYLLSEDKGLNRASID